MTETVALEIDGMLRNITETHLGIGFKQKGVMKSYGYPQGQNLRGFFGYEFLDFDAKTAGTYRNTQVALYFRDARSLHKDGGELLPIIAKQRFQNYQCNKCGEVLRFPSFKSTFTGIRLNRETGKVTGFMKHEGITKQTGFRFRALLNWKRGAEFAEEFIAACKKAEGEGIRLGRRKGKGKGLFNFEIDGIKKITLKEIKDRARELEREVLTLHFLSDVVAENSVDQETILRSVKNAGKFFHPQWENYFDPFIRIRDKQMLQSRQVTFLDRKEQGKSRSGKTKPIRERVIPAGSKVTIEVKGAPPMFYECLAIAERCKGIGSRNSFGKGEFRVT